MKELVNQQFLKYVNVEAKVDGGKLSASISVDADGLLDDAAAKAKALIPGDIDDALIDLFVSNIKSVLLA